jgi:hypothetical protein
MLNHNQLKKLKPKRSVEDYIRYLKHWEDHFTNASFLFTLPCTGGCWVILDEFKLHCLTPDIHVDDVRDWFPDKALIEGRIEQLHFEARLFFN